MENKIQSKAENFKKERKKKGNRKRLITILASIVVFCTVYTLIVPAFTWERSLICEQEEHKHTASCYETVTIPAGKQLSCEIPEHAHGSDCYYEVRTLVCGQEESELHMHSESCYHIDRTLSCPLAEHTHAGGCYTVGAEKTETKVICGKTEHIHTNACYDAPPASETGYFCGYIAHTHSKEQGCYASNGALKCTLPVHEHLPECRSNPKADLENASKWEASFADAVLTGDWAEDVLAIARTQLGYTESKRNFILLGDCEKGYTRYGAWYGIPYGDWCAMFASFCLNYAGVDEELFPQESACQTWVNLLSDEECDRYYPVGGGYMPKPGDIIFFDFDEYLLNVPEEDAEGNAIEKEPVERYADHVGIVSELIEETEDTPAQIKTIEGNYGNRVAEVTYNLDDETIMGYGVIPENPNPKKATKAGSGTDNKCWQAVTVIDDANAQYMVLRPTGGSGGNITGYAFGVKKSYNSYSAASSSTTLEPISGFDGYYTANVGDAFQWKFSAAGTSSKMTNVSYNDRGLRLDDDSIISKTTTNNTVRYNYDSWTISYSTGFGSGKTTYYLVCSSNGTFSRNKNTENNAMRLFKLVDKPQGGGGDEDEEETTESMPYRKQIDAFVDGVENPDTTLDNNAPDAILKDLSRLYVEFAPVVSEKPVDLVFVVDKSASMRTKDASVGTSTGIQRDVAVTMFLNGSKNKMTENGFISSFLKMNTNNRVAVVSFDGRTDTSGTSAYLQDSAILLDWTKYSNRKFVDCTTVSSRGTNYCAGLMRAKDVLANNPNNHKQVMIFLSDGLPTFYIKDSGEQGGNGSSTTDTVKNATYSTLDALRKAYPDLQCFTVGFGASFDTTVLNKIADSGSTFSTANTDALMAQLEEIFMGGVGKCYDVTLTDTLSEYVDIYEDQPDFKVSITDVNGKETTLYTQSGMDSSTGVYYEDADDFIASFEYDDETKTVTLKFKDDFEVEYGSSYAMSYNIMANETAYREYIANVTSGKEPYGDMVGDAETDRAGNTSSSTKPGFYTNANATTVFMRDEKGEEIEHNEEFGHPVIQLTGVELPPIFDEDMPYAKMVDALDGETDNPDTELDNMQTDLTDLYRLYVDIGPITETQPIDLLLIVDRSTSMKSNSDATVGDSTQKIRRDLAVTQILNGSQSKMTDSGFISQYLKMNKDNRLAVVAFGGVYGSSAYANDSTVLMNWSTYANRKFVDCTVPTGTHCTNYCAAFLTAENVLKNNPDNHVQVVVFLSDGVPSYYIENGTKGGTGIDSNASNVATCKTKTKAAFDNFISQYPNLMFYSVGFGANFDTEVLDYMATSKTTFTTQNVDALTKELEKLLTGGKGVCYDLTVTDTLSEYVDIYEAQPDFKISVIDIDGNEKVLYTQSGMDASTGKFIGDGADYVESFTYDPETKTVTVKYNSDLDLEAGSTYRVSYNIAPTQAAYAAFKETGYGEMIGDENTDYGENATSSGQPGFFANTEATATYSRTNVNYLLEYSHPVVQVTDTFVLSVEKEWADGTEPKDSVTFALYEKSDAAVIPALDASGEPICLTLNEEGEWKSSVSRLDPDKTYYLAELDTDGYYVSYSGDTEFIFVDSAKIGAVRIDPEAPSVTVTNTAGHELPYTGGEGVTLYYVFGSVLLMLAAGTALYLIRRKEEKNF